MFFYARFWAAVDLVQCYNLNRREKNNEWTTTPQTELIQQNDNFTKCEPEIVCQYKNTEEEHSCGNDHYSV